MRFTQQTGISMVGMLITLSVFALLVATGTMAYSAWQRQVAVSSALDQLHTVVSNTQQQAISGAIDSYRGIHFEEKTYTVFASSTYDVASEHNVVYTLSSVSILNPATTVSDGLGGRSDDVIFFTLSGTTTNTGTVTLFSDAEPSLTSALTILPTGRLDIVY